MKFIKIIEQLVPCEATQEIASVLQRGSRTEGSKALTFDRTYCHYTYKLIKHLLRGLLGLLLPRWFSVLDKDSGQSHFAHVPVRAIQLLLKSVKGE